MGVVMGPFHKENNDIKVKTHNIKGFSLISSQVQEIIMPRSRNYTLPPWLLLIIFLVSEFPSNSYADVGTAAKYSPPYLPTGCYGGEATQFPSSNLFAAAGDGIWDNGAACGRQYLVRCISAEQPRTCTPDQSIQLKIVDYAASAVSRPSATSTTLVLSDKAFATIANTSATLINIEFQQV